MIDPKELRAAMQSLGAFRIEPGFENKNPTIYKMIADLCSVSYASVNTHIAHIYAKLQVHSVAGSVSKAIKEGIV